MDASLDTVVALAIILKIKPEQLIETVKDSEELNKYKMDMVLAGLNLLKKENENASK